MSTTVPTGSRIAELQRLRTRTRITIGTFVEASDLDAAVKALWNIVREFDTYQLRDELSRQAVDTRSRSSTLNEKSAAIIITEALNILDQSSWWNSVAEETDERGDASKIGHPGARIANSEWRLRRAIASIGEADADAVAKSLRVLCDAAIDAAPEIVGQQKETMRPESKNSVERDHAKVGSLCTVPQPQPVAEDEKQGLTAAIEKAKLTPLEKKLMEAVEKSNCKLSLADARVQCNDSDVIRALGRAKPKMRRVGWNVHRQHNHILATCRKPIGQK